MNNKNNCKEVHTEGKKMQNALRKIFYSVMWICLILFAFRKVNQGVDLWDTGYNYANFTYMGMEHMDAMWLFSTWLSTVVGHLFTLLPGGDTLLGLNIYTTCIVVGLVTCIGMFYNKYFKVSPILVILGEYIALCLCWAPSAILYDYLTFFLLDVGLLFLFIGLTKENTKAVIISGGLIGANLFVRFSNLAHLVIVLGIVVFYLLAYINNGTQNKNKKDICLKAAKRMGQFLIGYLLVCCLFGGYIVIKYGGFAYIDGIKELLAMSKAGPAYSASFMLTYVISTLLKYCVRLWRVFVALLLGAIINVFAKRISIYIVRVLSIGLGLWIIWDYATKCDYISNVFTSYDSVYGPMIMLSLITMGIALIKLFMKSCALEEKYFGGIVIVVYLLSAVGSSTELLLAMNNLFLGMPYLFWQIYKMAKMVKSRMPMDSTVIVLCCFVVFCCYFAVGFGRDFVYTEAGSEANRPAQIENNHTLKNIYMSPYKADVLGGLSEYVAENSLVGREVILYNMNPGLSFYLQMPPAFNCWISLGSYSYEKLQADLKDVQTDSVKPILILTADFESDGSDKAMLLREFISQNEYEVKYTNGVYDLYACDY